MDISLSREPNFKQVEKGDQVVLQVTEALALEVEKN
jgi:hypothetical protein